MSNVLVKIIANNIVNRGVKEIVTLLKIENYCLELEHLGWMNVNIRIYY
jgi:hypothetical protein